MWNVTRVLINADFEMPAYLRDGDGLTEEKNKNKRRKEMATSIVVLISSTNSLSK